MMKDEERDFYFGDDDPEKIPYEVMEVSKFDINQVKSFNKQILNTIFD